MIMKLDSKENTAKHTNERPLGLTSSMGMTNPNAVQKAEIAEPAIPVPVAKGGVACPFPWRVHDMLEAVEKEGLDHIVSWRPHGQAFTVWKPKAFADIIISR
jgi:hypothetical protein